MNRRAWFAVCCCWLVALPAMAAPPSPSTKSRLKAVFDKADADHSGFLDRDELAKAYRGAKAKSPAGGMYDERGELTKLYQEARTKYPDLVLLWSADQDGNELLSFSEYESYESKIIANQQKQQQAIQKKQQAFQRSVQSAYRNQVRQLQAYQRSARSANYRMARSRQVQRAVQNNQRRVQSAYQAALRRRQQAQQRMLNAARQRQAAYNRALQQARQRRR